MDGNIIIFGRYSDTNRMLGVEKFVKKLYLNLDSKFNNTVFIDFFFGYSFKNIILKFFGKKKIKSDLTKEYLRLGIIQIIKYLIKNNPKSILITRIDTYLIPILIITKLFLHSKIYYTIHGLYKYELEYDSILTKKDLYNYKFLLTEHLILKMTDVYMFFSLETIEIFKKYYKIQLKKNYIIDHGVDDNFYFEKKNKNFNKILKVIYTGGYGRKLKGLEFLIESIQEINCKIDLTICGRLLNISESEFKKIIESYNFENVQYIGYLQEDKLIERFKMSDIFILPSSFETFSIITLEAMACSLVPIITKSCGVARVIKDGKNGYLINYGDKKKLKEIIEMIDKNRGLLKLGSERAYKTAQEFTWKRKTKKIFEIISK